MERATPYLRAMADALPVSLYSAMAFFLVLSSIFLAFAIHYNFDTLIH